MQVFYKQSEKHQKEVPKPDSIKGRQPLAVRCRFICLLSVLIVTVGVCLAACAPAGAKESEGSDGSENGNTQTAQVTWSPDMDCGTCHSSSQESYDNTACEASTHKEVTCIQCHADTDSLATVHEGKTATDKMPTRLKKTKVEDDLCLSCHYGDRQALIDATDGKAVVTDTQGTSCNPHDQRGIQDHESLACADCHNMHSDEPIQDRALSQCTGCHHQGVFECYTCHE